MTQPLIPSRRTFLAWAGSGAALLLAGCGSGSVADALPPKRLLIVGDGFCDQGQTGPLPTVNDGSMTWLQQMAYYYADGIAPVIPANQGGTAWAQVYAMVASPDTVSPYNTPSVQSQIDTMLASTSIANDDLVFINGGMADIMQAVTQTGISAATTATVKAAATALAAQVLLLTQNGGTHVAVIGVYDISISPWATSWAASAAPSTGSSTSDLINGISDLTVAFNDQLKININDLGAKVLFLDAALFYNLVYNTPTDYGLTDATTVVCDTPNALTCNTGTLISSVSSTTYNNYLFADDLHFTPAGQRLFALDNYGSNAYQRLTYRW
jgi:phospholipase/lecithinase/hemolysin